MWLLCVWKMSPVHPLTETKAFWSVPISTEKCDRIAEVLHWLFSCWILRFCRLHWGSQHPRCTYIQCGILSAYFWPDNSVWWRYWGHRTVLTNESLAHMVIRCYLQVQILVCCNPEPQVNCTRSKTLQETWHFSSSQEPALIQYTNMGSVNGWWNCNVKIHCFVAFHN